MMRFSRTRSLIVALIFISACTTVPITGRSQLSLISPNTLNEMATKEYKQFLAQHKLSSNQTETAMVRRVGQRIAKAVESYLASKGQSGLISGYKWEFNLVQDKQVNAWCMPGGKVVVYTGILPVAKDENGLAVVIGHEISHAVAQHGNERMSQQLLAQLGAEALSEALAKNPESTRSVFLNAYGLGAEVGALLPFNRIQETEADHLGLIFMSIAGYDPHRAISFWKEMTRHENGNQGPEFLSTHPLNQERMKNIEDFLPEAMKYYRPAPGGLKGAAH